MRTFPRSRFIRRHKVFPGKVDTGFPSGNTTNQRAECFQEKWTPVFRPETRQIKGLECLSFSTKSENT